MQERTYTTSFGGLCCEVTEGLWGLWGVDDDDF